MSDLRINDMDTWNKFITVWALARNKSVSFEVSYEECSDLWFGEVRSAAPDECKGFKKYGHLTTLLDAMILHLEDL